MADKIIEDVKKTIINKEKDKNNQYLILKIFEELLKMLHPFMPFITEEI
ncbi:MAG: class I tRNA ligase family protein [Candidatus Pacebacteria bacterium]|nr:class I tRNA ligase family protein [Candidatus Paceibacterota bacterium]